MKLYRVNTIVKEFHGFKDVDLNWWLDKSDQKRPYAELIEGYSPGNHYAEGAINELFTEDQARELKDYLDRENGHEGTTTIAEARLPIASNIMGCSGIPVGGLQDFLDISKRPDYPLPFKVFGYYDLRHYDRIGPNK